MRRLRRPVILSCLVLMLLASIGSFAAIPKSQPPEPPKPPLIEAIDREDLREVERLLAAGADPNKKSDGAPALFEAVAGGNTSIVRLLIAHGAKVDARIHAYGLTPLLVAAERGRAEVVDVLLSKGANANVRGGYWFQYRTPLMVAGFQMGDKKEDSVIQAIIQNLLKHGAELDAQDRDGRSALMIAARYYKTENASTLLTQGASLKLRDKEGNTALLLATEYVAGDTGIWRGDVALVKNLIAGGADIEARNNIGQTALMEAAEAGNREMVQLLLEKGAKIEVKDNQRRTALTWAAEHGLQNECVPFLLQHGAKKSVLDAILLGETDQALALLKSSYDRKARGVHGETALMAAAALGQREVVEALLKRHADVNARDEEGMTALMLAIRGRPRFSMVGRYFPATDQEQTRLEIVRALIAHKADVNAKEKEGFTALEWAMNKSQSFWTARSLALELPEFVRVLQQAGAKEQ